MVCTVNNVFPRFIDQVETSTYLTIQIINRARTGLGIGIRLGTEKG